LTSYALPGVQPRPTCYACGWPASPRPTGNPPAKGPGADFRGPCACTAGSGSSRRCNRTTEPGGPHRHLVSKGVRRRVRTRPARPASPDVRTGTRMPRGDPGGDLAGLRHPAGRPGSYPSLPPPTLRRSKSSSRRVAFRISVARPVRYGGPTPSPAPPSARPYSPRSDGSGGSGGGRNPPQRRSHSAQRACSGGASLIIVPRLCCW
jgi:hypothetical protein